MNEKMAKRPTSKIDILAAYQILGGLVGLGLLVYLITTLNSLQVLIVIMLLIAFILYCFSIFCGIMLFKEPLSGLKFSYINQLIQLVHFSISGYAFQYISGIHFSINLNLINLLNFSLNFGTSSWQIAFNQISDTSTISINLIALFLVIFIDKQISRLKSVEIADQLSSIGQPD